MMISHRRNLDKGISSDDKQERRKPNGLYTGINGFGISNIKKNLMGGK